MNLLFKVELANKIAYLPLLRSHSRKENPGNIVGDLTLTENVCDDKGFYSEICPFSELNL